MRIKLRTKLTLIYLIPVLGLFLVAGFLAHRAARKGLEEELGRRLSAISQSVAATYMTGRDACRIARMEPDPEDSVRTRDRLNGQLESIREQLDLRRIFLFRPDLSSQLDTNTDVMPGVQLFEVEADRAELSRITAGETNRASSVLFTDEAGNRYMNGYAPVYCEGELAGVVGAAGSASFFEALETFRAVLLLLGAMVIALVVIVSFLASHRLTQPIGRLVDAIRRFGRGELREPVVIRTSDEIGFLADAFNDMRGSLDRRDEQMQLMLSGIAHEVRNPLAGMELFCSLLSDELAGDPERQEYVDKISRELDYLGRVVNDVLRYARRRPLCPERFAADDLVREVTEGTEGLARERGVRVTTQVADGVELTGEREALRGVFLNMTQNAIQACEKDGEVSLTIDANGNDRVIEIRDTGRGIPADSLKKIFEPFYTTRQKGTGLGLALVHKTVREHGGDIDVESKAEVGTVFTVTLPFDAGLHPLVHEPDYETGSGDAEMIG